MPDRRGRQAIDHTGQRFGRLTVIRRAPNNPEDRAGRARWVCRCDCGRMTVIIGSSLRNGTTRSCGCLTSDPTMPQGAMHNRHLPPRRPRRLKRNTMPNPADLPANDLRTLLAQASDFAAALDEIAQDDPRRVLDVARQMTVWHVQLATALHGILGPEAERGMAVTDALTTLAEAVPDAHADPFSAWEHTGRQFDPQPPGKNQDRATPRRP